MRQVAADLRTFQDGRIPQDALDGFVLRLQITYRELLVQEQLDGLFLEPVGRLLREAMENLVAFQHEEPNCPQLTPSVICSGHVGRPKFDVPECQLTALVESRFTGVQIASIVSVSLSTVRRRMAEYGISVSSQYSQLSDEALTN